MTPIKYKPGTVKTMQHTDITSPAFSDTDHVRFDENERLTNIPPYAETSLSDTMKGRCRAIYAQRITGSNEGDYYLFGTHNYLYARLGDTTYNITPLVTSATATLGTDPLDTVSGDATLTINYTGHNMAVGDRFKLSGATDVGGVTAATYINKEHIVATVPDTNSITVEMGTTASSTASGGGGSVQIFKQIAAGNASMGTATGFGAGDYGAGDYGAGGTSSTGIISYPRIWSFAPFGNEVVMCPGDYTTGDGQKIYIWDGDTSVAPTVLTNAPTDCNWVMVVNNSIVALCGSTVKICALGAGTTWSGLLYRTKDLERVDRLFAGHAFGEKAAVLHYSGGMVLLRYVGGADLWDFSDLACDDTLKSPYSSINIGGAHVMRCTRGFYRYDGGARVVPIDNSQNMDWILDNENLSYSWHDFAVADQRNNEAYFYFTVGADTEPGDYVLYQPRHGSFTLGEMQRTAAQRTTPQGPAMLNEIQYFANSTSDTATDIYRHFTRGAVTFNWSAKTAAFFANNTDKQIFLRRFQPDARQSGDITLTITGKQYPNPELPFNALGTHTLSTSTGIFEPSAAAKLLQYEFSGSSAATLGIPMHDFRLRGAR